MSDIGKDESPENEQGRRLSFLENLLRRMDVEIEQLRDYIKTESLQKIRLQAEIAALNAEIAELKRCVRKLDVANAAIESRKS